MLLTPLSVSALAVPPLAQASSTTNTTTATTSTTIFTTVPAITPNLRQGSSSSRDGNSSRSSSSSNTFTSPNQVPIAESNQLLLQWHQPPWPSIQPHRPTTRSGKDVRNFRNHTRSYSIANSRRQSSASAVYSVKNTTTNISQVRFSARNRVSSKSETRKAEQYSGTRSPSSSLSSEIRSRSRSSSSATSIARSTFVATTTQPPRHLDYERSPPAPTHPESPESPETTLIAVAATTSTTAATANEDESIFDNVSLTVCVVIVSALFGVALCTFCAVVRCWRPSRGASPGALARPPLQPVDQSATAEHPVPMLSVQSPGYAGMERLGVPARTSLTSSADDRRLMCVDGLQMVRDASSMLAERHQHSHHHPPHHRHHHLQHGHLQRHQNAIHSTLIDCSASTSSSSSSAAAAAAASAAQCHQHRQYERRTCPHHVTLPDSEWGPDRDLQLRQQYQTELTRSYIKPPPNRTALDVPDHHQSPFNPYHPSSTTYHLNSGAPLSARSHQVAGSAGSCSAAAAGGGGGGGGSGGSSQSMAKSKPNPITKFFLRISSTKSAATQPPGAAATGAADAASRIQPPPPLPSVLPATGYLSRNPLPPAATQYQYQYPHQQHPTATLAASSGSSGSLCKSGGLSPTTTTSSVHSFGGGQSPQRPGSPPSSPSQPQQPPSPSGGSQPASPSPTPPSSPEHT